LNRDIAKEWSPGRLWIIGRAVLAVALMLGFYVLGATLGVGLCYVAYREDILLVVRIFCLIPGVFILGSMLPLPTRFVGPGPQLDPQQQPQLFERVNKITLLAGQPAPKEIYLTNEVNAWVSQRGGILGLGSKHIMGIGLPLLQLLTVSQFEAVLAHEFGHFYGRDTVFLMSWLNKTRFRIAFAVDILTAGPFGPAGTQWRFIGIPFKWYGRLFLRATQALSQIQERSADQFAADIAGPQAFAGGLRAIHRNHDAFHDYLHEEVMPAVRRGYKPPLVEGFTLYLQSERISNRLNQFVKEDLAEGSRPYDSHPPLHERLAALEHLPAGEAGDGSPALSLLNGVSELDARMFSPLFPSLTPISWKDIGREVLIPNWERVCRSDYPELRDLTLDSLPSAAATPYVPFDATRVSLFGDRVDKKRGYHPGTLRAALGCALLREGWQIDHGPGYLWMRHGDATLDPRKLIEEMRSPEFTQEKWREMLSLYQLDPAISLAPPSFDDHDSRRREE